MAELTEPLRTYEPSVHFGLGQLFWNLKESYANEIYLKGGTRKPLGFLSRLWHMLRDSLFSQFSIEIVLYLKVTMVFPHSQAHNFRLLTPSPTVVSSRHVAPHCQTLLLARDNIRF